MKTKLEPFEVIHEVVNMYGDAALVIDTSPDRTMKFTWMAVRKGGKWKVIAETSSRMSATP